VKVVAISTGFPFASLIGSSSLIGLIVTSAVGFSLLVLLIGLT